jgi:Virulence factor BrkB
MTRLNIRHCSITFGLLKRIATEWSTDNATRWSASVAFYTLLSLTPLLVLTVAIAGLVYGKRVAQGQLILGLRDLVGPDVGRAIQILLTSPHQPVSGLMSFLVSGTASLLYRSHPSLRSARKASRISAKKPAGRPGIVTCQTGLRRRTSAYDLACSNTPTSFPLLLQSSILNSNRSKNRFLPSERELSRAARFATCSQLRTFMARERHARFFTWSSAALTTAARHSPAFPVAAAEICKRTHN